MTGGANFARLIYPYASSRGSRLTRLTVGLKLDLLRLVLRIYDAVLVFVCSVCVCVCLWVKVRVFRMCVCGEYIREEERKRGGAGKSCGNTSF